MHSSHLRKSARSKSMRCASCARKVIAHTQAVQNGHSSYPPNPGAPGRTIPQARLQQANVGVVRVSYVENLSAARTTPADVFNSLLAACVGKSRYVTSTADVKRFFTRAWTTDEILFVWR